MVTIILRIFNAWIWLGILVWTATAFHAWGEPARFLSELLILMVLCFVLDRVIKRSERRIASVWNEPS